MYKQMMGLVAAFFATMMMSATTWAATDAGVILAATDASAKSADGTTRKLDRRSPVNAGDTLLTGAAGKLQVRMKDGTVLALGEGSEFAINSYTSKTAGDSTDSAALKLVKGSLMQVSGNMEKSAYSLETPVSTLGIRGTVFNIKVNADGTVSATVSTGIVTSAAGQAVTDAQAKLSTAKVKASKAKRAYEEAAEAGITGDALADLKAAADAADAEAADAQEALASATETAMTEIKAGTAFGTKPNGETVPVEPTTFDSITPEQILESIGKNNPADLEQALRELAAAFPEKADSFVTIGTNIDPTLGPTLQAAADEGKEIAKAEVDPNAGPGPTPNDVSPITEQDTTVPDNSTGTQGGVSPP